MAVVLLVAIRYRFSPDIPISFLISVALLPVTLRHLARHRWALPIAALVLVAAVSGILITELRTDAVHVSPSLEVVQIVRVLGLGVVLACLLWARSVLGTQRLVLVFGVGSLLSLGVSGLNTDNIWKFSFSVPVTLILLGMPWVWERRGRQLVCLGVLAAVSAAADSRSLAAMLVIAMAITVFERPELPAGRPQRTWGAVVRLGLVALAGYLVVQAAILEGMLGEAAKERTAMQIERSGNVIVGGRPEMGAALALIADRPLGYGSGVLVTYDERGVANEGMWAIGYDPDNGYVDNYMFGNGHEVHSVLGDLWLHFGLAGAALAVVVLLAVLASAGTGIASASISAVALFLAVRSAWDFALSPFPSAMLYLPLTLAILLPLREPQRDPELSGQGAAPLPRAWRPARGIAPVHGDRERGRRSREG